MSHIRRSVNGLRSRNDRNYGNINDFKIVISNMFSDIERNMNTVKRKVKNYKKNEIKFIE